MICNNTKHQIMKQDQERSAAAREWGPMPLKWKTLRDYFKNYFKINEQHLGTMNGNILMQIPKVKLEIAKDGFLFMGAKLYN